VVVRLSFLLPGREGERAEGSLATRARIRAEARHMPRKAALVRLNVCTCVGILTSYLKIKLQ
jgi:hypothetical protein